MSTKTRNLSNIGGANVSNPTMDDFTSTSLEAYANDLAYEADHGAGAAGDIYWNTTEKLLREHNGTAWQYDKLSLSVQTDSTSTGANQDITPANDQAIKFSNASLISIRSISPAIQKFLILINGTGATISIKNEDTGATAANRILTGTGADLSLENAKSLLLVYDNSSLRWRIVGGTGSGSGSSGINLVTSPDTAVGWTSSASPAAATTTTAAELPLGPLVPTAIKLTKTVAATYDAWRWTMPVSLMNMVIPISWHQIHETGAASGDWKLDVYTYPDATYTDGAKTRKPLRTDVSSVTSIPTATGFFGGGNVVSFDAFAEVYYEMRITRVTNNKYLSLAHVKIGPGDNGVAPADSNWQSYTPTFSAGLGSVSTINFWWRVKGPNVEIVGSFLTGTLAASIATFTLPNNYTTGSTQTLSRTFHGTWFAQTTPTSLPAFQSAGVVISTALGATTLGFDYQAQNSTSVFTARNGSTLFNNNVIITINCSVPIAELAGNTPLLVAPGNFLEYAYNTGVTTTAGANNSTSSSVAGPAGANIIAVDSVTAASFTSFDVQWQYPIQSDATIVVEISSQTGWVPADNIGFSSINQGTSVYGISFENTSSTVTRVYFANKGSQASNATYGGNGRAWSSDTSKKWRVRKAQAGILAGVSMAGTDGSAGPVSPYTAGSGVVYAGTYTPTPTNGSNTSASTPIAANYTRVGNQVTVHFQITATNNTAGGTLSILEVALPVASNFTSANDLNGVGTKNNSTPSHCVIYGSAANDRAVVQYFCQATANESIFGTFQYTIK